MELDEERSLTYFTELGLNEQSAYALARLRAQESAGCQDYFGERVYNLAQLEEISPE